MRHMYGACGPQGMLEEGWAGVESHWDALPLPSSFGAANQGRLPLLTSMDLAQHMPQVWVDRWGTVCFPTAVKRWEAASLQVNAAALQRRWRWQENHLSHLSRKLLTIEFPCVTVS